MIGEQDEEVLDPERKIIDAHHHLIEGQGHHYTIEDYAMDCARGHDIRASIYIEVRQKYLKNAPEHMRPVGETTFVAKVAEKAEGGAYDGRRLCAGIVGYADLSIGDRVGDVLDAHNEAAGGRFRGIRRGAYWDVDPSVYDHVSVRPPRGLLINAEFQRGFAQLAPRGLSFDAVLFHPQIPELTELAGRFPNTTIILNHLGFRLGVGNHNRNRSETDHHWRSNLAALAEHPNVLVKVGGLGMTIWGFDIAASERPDSKVLAEHWRPYFETGLELFGTKRIILESNYPVDAQTTTFTTLWNAFKRLTDTLSEEEKHRLYWDNANTSYKLGLPI